MWSRNSTFQRVSMIRHGNRHVQDANYICPHSPLLYIYFPKCWDGDQPWPQAHQKLLTADHRCECYREAWFLRGSIYLSWSPLSLSIFIDCLVAHAWLLWYPSYRISDTLATGCFCFFGPDTFLLDICRFSSSLMCIGQIPIINLLCHSRKSSSLFWLNSDESRR